MTNLRNRLVKHKTDKWNGNTLFTKSMRKEGMINERVLSTAKLFKCKIPSMKG